MSFWDSANQAEAEPLTPESLRRAWEAMVKQPPWRCPHIHPSGYVRRLRERGDTEAHCIYCGCPVRV